MESRLMDLRLYVVQQLYILFFLKNHNFIDPATGKLICYHQSIKNITEQ